MKESFLSILERHFKENLQGVAPLQKAIREKGWNRFIQMGLPEKHLPGYQYLPLSQFYQESFERGNPPPISKEDFYPFIHSECRCSHLVFVNGLFSPELSDVSGLPKQVVVLRLKDALSTYGTFLQTRLARSLTEEIDPFATLNLALIQMGLFFYVPPKVVVETPVQCLHITSNGVPTLFSPRIHLFMGNHSQLKWISETLSLSDHEYFSNGVFDIALEEGAQFEQIGVISPNAPSWHFEATRVTLKRDAKFKNLSFTTGSRSVRQDFRISLLGENSSCDLKGLSLLSKMNHAHTNVHMEHVAPHCHSMQLFKNMLSGVSRSSFEGKIFVHPEAQKTEAYQLNKNLILSDKALSYSKPNLEIFADDVKASHGATLTQLCPEHLLYLKMRGIDAETAKNLLVAGFYLDLLKEVPFQGVRERMQHLAESVLE